jgi:hypothetical protein
LTGLQKYVPRDEQKKMGWIDDSGTPNPRMKTVEQGAATSVWAAVASELDNVTGQYLEDCTIAKPWSDERPATAVRS